MDRRTCNAGHSDVVIIGQFNLKCGSKWLRKKNVKLTVYQVKLLHNWLAQLLVTHQLTCDYRSGFPGICDATNALLIYQVKWTFISESVGCEQVCGKSQEGSGRSSQG